jgi:glycosyltransferase involved in cell wall biosynthesis
MGRLSAIDREGDLIDKMRMWGYYVESSKKDAISVRKAKNTTGKVVRILWVGRLLAWKRVDTIIRAVGEFANMKCEDVSLPEITLDIYGSGPLETSLKKMAVQYGDIVKFHPPIPIDEVRKLMREHDVYVLASNGYEGWGAVVSEAIEEGMTVLGTYEAGSSATILPEGSLFHTGDWRALKKLLSGISCKTMENYVNGNYASLWTAEAGAKALCEYLEEGGFNE